MSNGDGTSVLKSHPKDWQSRGIDPAILGLVVLHRNHYTIASPTLYRPRPCGFKNMHYVPLKIIFFRIL